MNILAAVDGSESSFNALRTACRLARSLRSYVTAFHVSHHGQYPPELTKWPSIEERLDRELETRQEQTLKLIKDTEAETGVPLEIVVSTGVPAQEILSYIEDNGIVKLVAMGHPLSGYRDGTVRAVITESRAPVLVVSTDLDIRSLLIPVKDAQSSAGLVRYAGKLAVTLNAAVTLMAVLPDVEAVLETYRHIGDVPRLLERGGIKNLEGHYRRKAQEALDACTAELAALNLSVTSVISQGDYTEVIRKAAGSYDLLLVKGKESVHGPGLFVQKLLSEKEICMLVVKER